MYVHPQREIIDTNFLPFLALAAGSCHSTFHNLDKCVQFFEHGGRHTPSYNEEFCKVFGGYTLRDDGDSGTSRTGICNDFMISDTIICKKYFVVAAWQLMKALGVHDLRARRYPALTELIMNSTADMTTFSSFNWPVTRLEGDYCENTVGVVCQRSAAAGAKSEAQGRFCSHSLGFLVVILFLLFC